MCQWQQSSFEANTNASPSHPVTRNTTGSLSGFRLGGWDIFFYFISFLRQVLYYHYSFDVWCLIVSPRESKKNNADRFIFRFHSEWVSHNWAKHIWENNFQFIRVHRLSWPPSSAKFLISTYPLAVSEGNSILRRALPRHLLPGNSPLNWARQKHPAQIRAPPPI